MESGGPRPDQALTELLAAVPFIATLGIEVVSARPEEVVGRLAWRAELCTGGGVLNGGALMSLADNMGGTCAFLGVIGP
jgi:1,4-dihydroxy-2-naphthoyl-CoA hydrolase